MSKRGNVKGKEKAKDFNKGDFNKGKEKFYNLDLDQLEKLESKFEEEKSKLKDPNLKGDLLDVGDPDLNEYLGRSTGRFFIMSRKSDLKKEQNGLNPNDDLSIFERKELQRRQAINSKEGERKFYELSLDQLEKLESKFEEEKSKLKDPNLKGDLLDVGDPDLNEYLGRISGDTVRLIIMSRKLNLQTMISQTKAMISQQAASQDKEQTVQTKPIAKEEIQDKEQTVQTQPTVKEEIQDKEQTVQTKPTAKTNTPQASVREKRKPKMQAQPTTKTNTPQASVREKRKPKMQAQPTTKTNTPQASVREKRKPKMQAQPTTKTNTPQASVQEKRKPKMQAKPTTKKNTPQAPSTVGVKRDEIEKIIGEPGVKKYLVSNPSGNNTRAKQTQTSRKSSMQR